MIEKLNKQFIGRYKNLFSTLNKNVVLTVSEDDGTISVPVVVVGDGGATVSEVNGNFDLNPSAAASVKVKKMKAQTVVYRLTVPLNEAIIAADKPEYFNYLFDNILHQALGRYNNTFGGVEVSRFGESYCIPHAFSENVFLKENDGGVELRLVGKWASDKEHVEERNDEQGN